MQMFLKTATFALFFLGGLVIASWYVDAAALSDSPRSSPSKMELETKMGVETKAEVEGAYLRGVSPSAGPTE